MAHRLMWRAYSYNPAAGGGPGSIADGSVSSAKLGGDVTTAGKALLTSADAGAQRTALGLGTAATSASTAFAAASHTHAQGDITGLATALAGKADTAHTHTAAQISDSTTAGRAVLTAATASAQRTALGLGTAATSASGDFAAASHTHTIANVTGLQTALDGKQAAGSYAAGTHSHAIADTTGLQTALDGKAASSHTHTAAQISDSTTAGRTLLTAADASAQRTALGLGTAATSASTAFQAADATLTALAGLSATAGVLEQTGADAFTKRALGVAAATDIPTRGDADTRYAAASHTHTAANVTDFAEAVDDRVSALLVAGSNVTLTYDDGANTLTVSATASGGVTDGDKGDITVSASGATWTIDNSVVTSAKLGGDITNAGKSLLTAADAATQRGTLGLGTAATSASTAFAAASHSHSAADLTSGTVATARLGSGTANSTTFLRGDQTWATPAGGGGLTLGKAILSSTQANSTVTPAVMTGATFTLTPGQTGTFTAILIVTAAATTTGVGAGFRVAQGAGADANARGAWSGYVNLSSSAAATGLADGDVYNVAAGADNYGQLLGTATTSGNNAMQVEAVVQNLATNVNTTVTFEFRSEVGNSAVTAQIGSAVTAIIG